MTYNPSIGAPNWRPVKPYSRDCDKDLPKSYVDCQIAYEWAIRRRGGAKGKLAANTKIHQFEVKLGEWKGSLSYAIRLHDTDIVIFHADDSVELNSGGYQTFTTRDRMNRCGIRIGMADGVPSVIWHGQEHAFRDGMRLHAAGGVTGPPIVGTIDQIRQRRRRALAKARKGEVQHVPWYWPNRSGGYTIHNGTVPEAFHSDADCGLHPMTRRKDASKTARYDADFAGFCRNATDAQLDGIEEKERAAGRTGEVAIVQAEKRARGSL
jgi:hypothetical protein